VYFLAHAVPVQGTALPMEVLMVSLAGKTRPRSSAPAWHEVFLRLAPAIAAYAKVAFRDLRAEARAEAVQNALCCACAAVARLAELNKLELCYPTVLGKYDTPFNLARRSMRQISTTGIVCGAATAMSSWPPVSLRQWSDRWEGR
jgi:hypothetical protein